LRKFDNPLGSPINLCWVGTLKLGESLTQDAALIVADLALLDELCFADEFRAAMSM